jgi:hypothetical protein
LSEAGSYSGQSPERDFAQYRRPDIWFRRMPPRQSWRRCSVSWPPDARGADLTLVT